MNNSNDYTEIECYTYISDKKDTIQVIFKEDEFKLSSLEHTNIKITKIKDYMTNLSDGDGVVFEVAYLFTNSIELSSCTIDMNAEEVVELIEDGSLVSLDSELQLDIKKCKCELTALFNLGCKCGGE